jgi:sugar phosphate isomerase/epimerase
VGVSSGIYTVARTPELSSIVRKLGYALTRGTNTVELAGDVPHEIDYTQGKELRYIAEKQGLTLLFHGSLTVPMTMPERGEWRDAQDHIQKSVRSAVMAGCKYVNFHACLHYWLEMMTYAGRKLTMAFCDHKGFFIKGILKENKKLRDWFVTQKWDVYGGDILTDEERRNATVPVEIQFQTEREEQLIKVRQREERGEITQQEANNIRNKINEDISNNRTRETIENYKKAILEKLENGARWDSEELRAVVGILDGYHIMAHHLFYEKDPIWETMVKVYKDVIDRYRTVSFRSKGGEEKNYTYPEGEPSEENFFWLDGAWEQAEQDNDREFKEFFYAVCAGKYVQGHIEKTFEWIKDEENGLLAYIENHVGDKDDKEKLKKAAKELKITLEIPDARSPEYAGLYTICRVKQIYAGVKTIREQIVNDGERVYMLIDFEHIATQGFDVLDEIKTLVKDAPDVGKVILSLHVTKPTPLHHHIQVDIGDIDVYKLIYQLRTAGLGKYHTTYLIYERGGERDPFKQSVIAIRLMVDQLLKETKPEELVSKPEFFGVKGPAIGSEERQRVIIAEHAEDPIEGLVAIPEEEYTFLSKAAREKGAGEKWKKEELA